MLYYSIYTFHINDADAKFINNFSTLFKELKFTKTPVSLSTANIEVPGSTPRFMTYVNT